MKLLRDDEVPGPPEVESYRETVWSGLWVGFAMLAAAITVIVWPIQTGALNDPSLFWFIIPMALMILLITHFAFRTFTASRRADAWRLRWSADGLYIRYRSYLNSGFDRDAPTVLHLTRREVTWIKARIDTLNAPDGRGNWTQREKHRWLEIGLRRIDPAPIKAALAEESSRRTPSGGRVNDDPLTVTSDDTLRVALRKPEAAVDLLGYHFAVALSEETHSGDFVAMTGDEKEAHVLALVEAGDSIGAIKAAREVYGMDLTDAKQFIDGLQGRD
jgi:hypothetical protein